MKIKTSELIGPALDWAVAKCEGYFSTAGQKPEYWESHSGVKHFIKMRDGDVHWTWTSSDWAEAGPIIDREDITWSMNMSPEHGDPTRYCAFSYRVGSNKAQNGPTKLIAAMRCYVASKVGDEVEVLEELLNH